MDKWTHHNLIHYTDTGHFTVISSKYFTILNNTTVNMLFFYVHSGIFDIFLNTSGSRIARSRNMHFWGAFDTACLIVPQTYSSL